MFQYSLFRKPNNTPTQCGYFRIADSVFGGSVPISTVYFNDQVMRWYSKVAKVAADRALHIKNNTGVGQRSSHNPFNIRFMSALCEYTIHVFIWICQIICTHAIALIRIGASCVLLGKNSGAARDRGVVLFRSSLEIQPTTFKIFAHMICYWTDLASRSYLFARSITMMLSIHMMRFASSALGMFFIEHAYLFGNGSDARIVPLRFSFRPWYAIAFLPFIRAQLTAILTSFQPTRRGLIHIPAYFTCSECFGSLCHRIAPIYYTENLI